MNTEIIVRPFNKNYGRLSTVMCPVYPSPSQMRVKDYIRLESQVRNDLVIREVKARLKADARLAREARKMWSKARKG